MNKVILVRINEDIKEIIFPTNKSRWIKNMLLERIEDVEDLSKQIFNFGSSIYMDIVKKSHEIKDSKKNIAIKMEFNTTSEKEKQLYLILKSLGSPYIRGALIYKLIQNFLKDKPKKNSSKENKEKIKEENNSEKKSKTEKEDLDNLKIF